MGETTHISWADHTFNPWVGCTRISNGPKGACAHCYAANLMDDRLGRVVFGGPGLGVGTRERTSPENWLQPLKWDRKAKKEGKRPLVFCASLADVFDNAVPPEWRHDLFDLIRTTPHLVWLLLTKRTGNIAQMAREAGGLPRNAAIGCTVVTQKEAEQGVRELLRAKMALHPHFAFLSIEPMMEEIDLRQWLFDYGCGCGWGGEPLAYCDECGWRGHAAWGEDDQAWCPECKVQLADYNACPECDGHDGDGDSFGPNSAQVDWVICGGETDQGPHKARPSHPDWFRSLRDQCATAGVPFHFKQWGEWTPGENVERHTGHVKVARLVDDDWAFDVENLADSDGHIDDEPDVYRVGKKAAGRRLDGVIHDAMPGAR